MRKCWILIIYFCVTLFIPLIDSIQTNAESEIIKWINQTVPMDIYEHSEAHVSNITMSNILYYPALYFIHEKLPNSSLESDLAALKNHLHFVNYGLAKGRILSYVRGLAYIPKPPLESLAKITGDQFYNLIDATVKDILANQLDDLIFTIFMFNHSLNNDMNFIQSSVCAVNTIFVWNQQANNRPYNVHDDLIYLIFRRLSCPVECWIGGRSHNCFSLEEKTLNDIHPNLLKCVADGGYRNNYQCGRSVPKSVGLPVCGNGLVEGPEFCDCLDSTDCPDVCNPRTCLRQTTGNELLIHYLALIISAFIVSLVTIIFGLIFLYFFKRSSKKRSSMSIALSRSVTEANYVAPPIKSGTIRAPSKKSRSLIDPTFKINKSKLLVLDRSIDLSIKKIDSGIGTKSKLKFDINKTLPIPEYLSNLKVSQKSSNELFTLSKGELRITSKILPPKVKIQVKSLQQTKSTKSSIENFNQESYEPLSVATLDYEIENYLITKDARDVIAFWSESKNSWPNLSKLASCILAIPATSTPVERLFSVAGLTITKKRSQLKPEKLHKILFIHENIDFVEKTYEDFDIN